MPLEQASSLGRSFDFIEAMGVLHHLADPLAGLTSLRDVLRREGSISAMIYGLYPRSGLYMLQALFRRLGAGLSPEGLGLVKETIELLPENHPATTFIKTTPEFSTDTGRVDGFLHTRDRAYTVPDCLKLVADAGMEFQGWHEPILYYPDAQVPLGTRLRAALDALPDRVLWEAMEMFHGGVMLHAFHACRSDRPQESYRLNFAGADFAHYVPLVRDRVIMSRPASGFSLTLELPPFPRIGVDAPQAALLSAIDGRRTIAQCMMTAGTTEEAARQLFVRLWRIGYLHFRRGV